MAKFFKVLVVFVSICVLLQLITLYLSWQQQMMLGGASIFIGLAVNRFSASRVITLALMLISMTATFRYAWWRGHLLIDFFSDSSNHRFSYDSVFMLILISAEAYTILIMVLGYMQTAWPLHRRPILLPNDESTWPHVDVLIPTYNEPLSLVRYTALAAVNIDYPQEKLHVYILDDGSRKDFADFAALAGVGYVTREEHKHAKAGNINHALTLMDSPFVAIFDCDHVPTRSFLQMTLGWMLADKKLAMLQTPHHFYSPDPFERNLLQYKTIPSEAELFYGIIQDGNDLWNATFFCGSCAVIRRTTLDEVGGIAVETVTEDAHTSLRMQKLGYNTAYINIPQAAGLSTETLAAHVGQRIRWARGMIQIFRTDNPLLASGLKFTQRLCYLNAMIHFLYAVPRLVFLCAPLVYMLLGKSIIPGYWVAIVAYSIPHLILASLTNSRIQGRHRHSFWNEIYEAVLAPYILAPTLLALINPKLGKFNVTDKGSTLSDTRFDSRIATPTKWLLLLNLLGLVMAPYRIFIKDPHHPGTVLMNLVWILFNMVILGVAAAVAHEQKQRRGSVRIEARIPVRLDLTNGRQIHTVSIDMSVGGASLKLPANHHFVFGDRFKLAFPENAGEGEVGARVVGMKPGELRIEFEVPTIGEQETLTRAIYSRADAWITSIESKETDQPLKSLGRVIVLSFSGFNQVIRSLLPEKTSIEKPKALPATTGIVFLCLVSGGFLLRASTPPAPDSTSSTIEETSIQDAVHQVLSLKDMGIVHTIELRGPHSYYSVKFTLPNTLVPRRAALSLHYNFDPTLDPHTTSLKITLNRGGAIATLTPQLGPHAENGSADVEVTVPADQLVRSNTLTFEFTGSGMMQREDQSQSKILARISPDSGIEVDGDRLRLQNDLGQLPLPVFDTELQSTTTIPFVFLSPPTSPTLEAAGTVASWFGVLASSKPVHFSVSIGEIPKGDVVLFSENRSTLPAALHLPADGGPILALRDNPSDPSGSILVIAGDDENQLVTAARTLSLTKRASPTTPSEGLPLSGDTVLVPALIMPAARNVADAPRWLPLGSAARLASCSSQDKLQTGDSSSIPIYFHVPPDVYYGERENIKLHLHYRYNAPPVGPGSALRVIVNGELVNETALPSGTDFAERMAAVPIPVSVLRPFGNTILFNFDFIPVNPDTTQASDATALKGEIFCDSSLDLHGLALWTPMPNLELFANAGFPFTQKADLSESVVILPTVPGAGEIALYLHLMGHFGAQTGYPALRVRVAAPNAVISSVRDYLVLGSVANQPAFDSLQSVLPVTFDSNGIHVKASGNSFSVIEEDVSHWWAKLWGRQANQSRPSSQGDIPAALIEEIRSPASPRRSFVVIALRSDETSEAFSNVFLDGSQSHDLTSSVGLLRMGKFESYAMNGKDYSVGSISWFAIIRLWLTRYFLLLLLVATAFSFVLAAWTRGWLSERARERLKLAETSR
jgi:cellulose synthase (UDP-forming)